MRAQLDRSPFVMQIFFNLNALNYMLVKTELKLMRLNHETKMLNARVYVQDS